MGNPKNGGTLKIKNQPTKLQLSAGISGHSGTNSATQEKEIITIKLENLDTNVVQNAKKDDVITLLFQSRVFEAQFQNQRIGDVPIAFNSRLLTQREYSGWIFQVQLDPEPFTIIKVRLKSAE